MASPNVRMVRCPRCHSLLQEPSGVPAYQCGGCGATLRVKTFPASSSSGLPPQTQSRQVGGSGDVASTTSSRSFNTPPAVSDARSGERQAAKHRVGSSDDVASTSSTPDVLSASKRASDATENRERDPTSNRGVPQDDFEFPSCQRDTTDTPASERDAGSPGVSVNLLSRTEDATRTSESQQVHTVEKMRKGQAELADGAATRKQHSRDASAAAAGGGGGGKVVSSSPCRHELQTEEEEEEDLAPLRHKILKTVDALRGDLSELFSKSPDLNPTKRPPRLPIPDQQGNAARTRHAARAAAVVSRRSRHAVRHGKQGAPPPPPPPRGLPSRRYRRCRADTVQQQPESCRHHGCCRRRRHHHGNSKPECSSCRGHCARPTRAHEPSSAPPAANKEANKRRPPPPRHHCRPVLKGAPFIVCSSCFTLVQVPADFAVSNDRVRRLRCGSCSAVLSYSYRDPARRKKLQDDDRLSTDSDVRGGGPFAPFVDDFGLSSYSTTEDEQPPLHVSRNTSFDTVDAVKGGADRLHRLMGYGSASDLLLRRSPDLYESFDKRTTTPDDRKGKAVCIDNAEDDDLDDSDDDDNSGVLKRTAARGAVRPLPGMLGRGAHGPGAIKIK